MQNYKKIAIISLIVFVIAGIPIYLYNKKDPIGDQWYAATTDFYKNHSYEEKSSESKEISVKIISGEPGWEFEYENINFNQVESEEVPIIATQDIFIRNKLDDKKYILNQGVYVYNNSCGVIDDWCKISETSSYIDEENYINREKMHWDIWQDIKGD